MAGVSVDTAWKHTLEISRKPTTQNGLCSLFGILVFEGSSLNGLFRAFRPRCEVYSVRSGVLIGDTDKIHVLESKTYPGTRPIARVPSPRGSFSQHLHYCLISCRTVEY